MNCTFDHSSQDLLNRSIDVTQNTGSKIKKRSYRVLNRSYVKSSKETGSESRSFKKLEQIRQSNEMSSLKLSKHPYGSRNNMTISDISQNYESVKIPRSSLKLYTKDNAGQGINNSHNLSNSIRNV